MLPLGDIGALCGDIFGATGPEWVTARGAGDGPAQGGLQPHVGTVEGRKLP